MFVNTTRQLRVTRLSILRTRSVRVLGARVRVLTAADVRPRGVTVGASARRPTGGRVTGHPSGGRPCAVFRAAAVAVVDDYHFFSWGRRHA